MTPDEWTHKFITASNTLAAVFNEIKPAMTNVLELLMTVQEEKEEAKTELQEEFPFLYLGVGDSFAVPADMAMTAETHLGRHRARMHQNKSGRSYSSRILASGERRIWRIK